MDSTGIDSKTLNRTQNILKGRGFLGWLTQLFMGRKFQAEMARAGQAIDQLDLQHSLLASGKPGRAVVVAIRDTGSMINFNPVVLLMLKVQPVGGQEFTASLTTPVSKMTVPRVGDVLSVRYDPQDRSRIALAP